MSSSSRLLFSFRDVDVYSHHLEFFRPRNWLDDSCLNLCQRLYESERGLTAQGDVSKVLLVDPAIISFIQLQVDDEQEYLEVVRGQGFDGYEWLFFPINDSISFSHSGSHWSLMICHWKSLTFLSVDSGGSTNRAAVECFAEKLAHWRGLAKEPLVIDVPCPRQSNGYDCGIYVILFSERIADFIRFHPPFEPPLTESFVSQISETLVDISDQKAFERRKVMVTKIHDMSR